MSQIATEVQRDPRESGPSATPPSTRYAPPAAAARAPNATTSSNVAGNQISLQAALTAANGDPRLALETILGERNTLSSQNSQLWKIIEKQRGMYNSLHKELDRVKAERDRLQSRSSSESSTKRPSGGDSTSKKQVTRSQSEDRRESQSFALLYYYYYRLEKSPIQTLSHHVTCAAPAELTYSYYWPLWPQTCSAATFYKFARNMEGMGRIPNFACIPIAVRQHASHVLIRLFTLSQI